MSQSPRQSSDDNDLVVARQSAMAAMAKADMVELEAILAELSPVPSASDLRPPEIGLVMLRGRTGGEGAPFNLGEATVSRAAVRLEGGATGFAYRLGRQANAARAAAMIDALWQDDARRDAVEAALEPVRERLAFEAGQVRAETAATKVEFFTLVRGED